MKIAFVIKKLSISDPLGIQYLSASLKKAGHQTYLICSAKENWFEKLSKINPEIVAYSITTGTHQDMIQLNREIKKNFKVYSIFGGPHPTFYPEIINEDGVDAVCIGEGEEALVEFVNNFEKKKDIKKIKNFWIKQGNKIFKNPLRNLNENLDALPFPDRELIYQKDPFFREIKIKRFMTSRGCPFKCTYCFNRHYNQLYKGKGKIVRHRTVANVIQEIKEIKEKYPLGTVKFIDDTFNIDKEWLKEFCQQYKKEIDLPFICNIRADILTEETAEQLKKANCIIVYMGIETGNEKLRKELLERNMSNEQILKACRILRKKGIKIVSQNMLGLPGETLENSFESILFNSKCHVTFPGFSIFQPYPKTILSEYAKEHGLFDNTFDDANPNFFHETVLKMKPEEKTRLENLTHLSTLLAKFPQSFFLVKHLIKYPKNKFYELVHFLLYGFSVLKVYSTAFGSRLNLLKYAKRFREYSA